MFEMFQDETVACSKTFLGDVIKTDGFVWGICVHPLPSVEYKTKFLSQPDSWHCVIVMWSSKCQYAATERGKTIFVHGTNATKLGHVSVTAKCLPIDLILNMTVWLWCLHKLLIEYFIQIPVYLLQTIVWLWVRLTLFTNAWHASSTLWWGHKKLWKVQ